MATGALRHAAPARYPDDLQALDEEYLAELRFGTLPAVAGLEDAMRNALLAGGRRIRLVLALATAHAVGRGPREVLPSAAALDLVHTFSPSHDDLPVIEQIADLVFLRTS